MKMSKNVLNKGLISSLVLALVLTACKSTPMQEVEAPVEDKTVVETSAPADNSGADTGEIKEMNIDSSTTSSYVSPLNDPNNICLLYTSPSPRDRTRSRMPSSA